MFTKIKVCHYCWDEIVWKEHDARRYNLDRKDNRQGYSAENCVVCCSRCNMGKSNMFSYDEWYGMTSYLRYREAYDDRID